MHTQIEQEVKKLGGKSWRVGVVNLSVLVSLSIEEDD